jgi:hypothetical protein
MPEATRATLRSICQTFAPDRILTSITEPRGQGPLHLVYSLLHADQSLYHIITVLSGTANLISYAGLIYGLLRLCVLVSSLVPLSALSCSFLHRPVAIDGRD